MLRQRLQPDGGLGVRGIGVQQSEQRLSIKQPCGGIHPADWPPRGLSEQTKIGDWEATDHHRHRRGFRRSPGCRRRYHPPRVPTQCTRGIGLGAAAETRSASCRRQLVGGVEKAQIGIRWQRAELRQTGVEQIL